MKEHFKLTMEKLHHKIPKGDLWLSLRIDVTVYEISQPLNLASRDITFNEWNQQ